MKPPNVLSSGEARWLLILLVAGAVISYMHRLVLGVLVGPIGADLSLGDTEISLLQGAAFAVIYVFAGLPLGRLADRGNRRNLIIWGSGLWSFGTLLCSLAPDFWPLFGARCIVGIGEATLAPAAASMISDSFAPHRRGTALGVFLTGTVLGGPAAIAIGGPLLAAAQLGAFAEVPLLANIEPWRIVLLLFAVSGFILPLALLTTREPPRAVAAIDSSPADLGWFVSAKAFLLPLLLGVALLSVGDYGIFSWAPTAIIREHGWLPGEIGAAFGLITSVAGVAGAFAGGALSDVAAARAGDRARLTLTAGAAIVAGTAATLFAAGSAPLALAGIGIWMLASAAGAVSGIAALQALAPPPVRGLAMSMIAFCNTLLGLGLGPSIIAVAGEHMTGPSATSTALATVIPVAAALSAALATLASKRGRTLVAEQRPDH